MGPHAWTSNLLLLLLDTAGEGGFNGLADAKKGDGFKEGFVEAVGEVLRGFGGAG